MTRYPWHMALPEILTLALLAGAAFLFNFTSARRLALPSVLLAGTALFLDLWYRGPAFQLVPAVVAWILLSARAPWATDQSPRFLTSYTALSLLSTSLGLLILLPFFKLPQPTGPYSVGTRTLHWVDSSRNLDGSPATPGKAPRELAIQLWYPAADHDNCSLARYVQRAEVKPIKWYWAGIRTNSWQDAPVAARSAPFPILVYGHSWGSRRTVDTFLAEDLASHGYVVVALDHPLNSERMQRADGSIVRTDRADALGNVQATTAPALESLWNHELDRWVADDSFVLDGLERANNDPTGWLTHRLDFSRVGAFGHSFGGAASLALLGRDPRVKAGVNFDGWVFGGIDHRTHQPILTVYGGEPPVTPNKGVEGILDHDDTTGIDTSMSRYGGIEAFVTGAYHQDFTDETLVSPFRRITYTGPIGGERIRLITREMLLAFFNRSLRGNSQPLPKFPEVRIVAKP
jgi:predicted dienelactone hydrolase